MAKKGSVDRVKLGHYSFIAGLIVAVIVALLPQARGDIAVWIMVTLGVVVGLLNITTKEINSFLIASMALIIASSASALSLAIIWTGLTVILGNVIVFVAPAAIVVSIKAVYALAQAK